MDETLADQIFAKINANLGLVQPESTIDDNVRDVYNKVGIMLSRYRSGKIPKAFKIVPRLKNWKEILYITQPDSWTPNSTYQATKIFISGMNPHLAEEFLSEILLPKIRQDIAQHKKLNVHYYESLKKAIYKPAALFKGIVLNLCEQPDCTLKEASIISSVLAKMSVPVLHSAAALLRLLQQDYSGPRSIMIKTLLDKKYALPRRVVDACVEYFLRFKVHDLALPVLWHQSFLIFAQRYKNELEPQQRSDLIQLLADQHHDQISVEIARELDTLSA